MGGSISRFAAAFRNTGSPKAWSSLEVCFEFGRLQPLCSSSGVHYRCDACTPLRHGEHGAESFKSVEICEDDPTAMPDVVQLGRFKQARVAPMRRLSPLC